MIINTLIKKPFLIKQFIRKQLHILLNPNFANAHPIFVVGWGRSGTTSLINVFGHSLDTAIYNETDLNAFYELRLKDFNTIGNLIKRCKFKLIVFKPLQDSHRILEILDRFPGSKAIWIFRDVGDVVNSSTKIWGDWEKGFHDFNLLIDKKGRFSETIFPDTFEFFKKHYHPGVSPEDAVSLGWYMCNMLYIQMNLKADSRIMLVNYEQLVKSPSSYKSIFAFADCEFKKKYIKGVYSTSVGKEPFPKISEPILERCEWLFDHLLKLTSKEPEILS
jgi:hypothetical protein